MQFLEIEFLKFGCFTQTRLDLGPVGPRLHVIHGPNEAGKSTAMRGLTDFLYGIPNRSTDNFRHKNNDPPQGNERYPAECRGEIGRRRPLAGPVEGGDPRRF